ncbi:MAG: M23 family metallopeptidase [Candidatus Thiodiazotropha sp.]|nr:M23 family metallopeptidase [Candidatus Thiodiazotropha sp. (ex Lucina pensylvanica)]MBT3063513.1 M23 family metallopeptidase [Candidatus Thiodiazotropha sp. (ex Lucina pensylvanica)]MBV2095229.1 M23 family metallopeptidase [Candidatus Thiodiazotropha sp. (ex Codakia orbicularis)]PUB74134.1 MAG: peptidase M23 [gamma proteobacterium symbiont of Ctena orbiculata]PUB76024.1 MAG: peptidase M23 [gamma proteobacterium symbiont of Ctena orbiculata]
MKFIPSGARRVIHLLLLFICLPPLSVAGVSLDGEMVQGGMLIGKTEPGDRVSFDNRPVRVSPEGVFLLGFGRDDELRHTLVVSRGGRQIEKQQFTIGKREYRIQKIDGLPPSKVTPPERDWERIKRETALVKKARRRDDDRSDFMSGFIWPAKGIISGVYGSQRILNGEPRRPHFGIDIAAPVGSPVVAPADGVVTLAHPDMFFSGGTLIIDHGHQLSSSFLHLHKILVREGDRVKQGDPIAEIGATGRVTGAHLDWRMNLRKARIDPQLLVPPMPKAE